jgi:hypothetical protein
MVEVEEESALGTMQIILWRDSAKEMTQKLVKIMKYNRKCNR